MKQLVARVFSVFGFPLVMVTDKNQPNGGLWIIEELEKIGCDTARSVLTLTIEDLANRTDLEVETVEDVVKILKAEFDA